MPQTDRLTAEREAEIRSVWKGLSEMEGDSPDEAFALCAVDDLLVELDMLRAERRDYRDALAVAGALVGSIERRLPEFGAADSTEQTEHSHSLCIEIRSGIRDALSLGEEARDPKHDEETHDAAD